MKRLVQAAFVSFAIWCGPTSADEPDKGVTIFVFDGTFEIISGSVTVRDGKTILTDATIRVRNAIVLNEEKADGFASGKTEGKEASYSEQVFAEIVACWNAGSLSASALGTTIKIAFRIDLDGRPNFSTIHLIEATGGSDAAARQAFEAARRAIIRCGANGFDLPVEKYDHWRDIEMTFNPEKMRIK